MLGKWKNLALCYFAAGNSIYETSENTFMSHIRERRAFGERNVVALVLDKDRCALISSALDDCKIAACRDEDKNPIRGPKSDPLFQIPQGAICRIKCRQVKSQRCKCCEQGFAIGKECPSTDSVDNCNLKADSRALYEGPGAELVPAMSWSDCYDECTARGMQCHAASYVRLRFNAMCWIFNHVTTRYADDVNPNAERWQANGSFAGPNAFGGGLFNTRSFAKQPVKKTKKVKPIEQKPLLEIPDVMLPDKESVSVFGRSLGFRNPHKQTGISIAKGDARAPEGNFGDAEDAEDEPEMMSWHRQCS